MTQQEFENEIEEYWIATGWSKVITLGKFKVIARYFYGLGLNEKQDIPEGLDEAAVDGADTLLAKPKDYALAAKSDYWNGAHDGFKAGAEWAFGQFESMGTFPVEDARGGYWPTEYFVRKK